MTNKEIARKFNLLGKLLELHGESSFKTRSYTNAYLTIRKWPDPLAELSPPQLAEIKGIGKAIQSKIQELVQTGEMQSLNRYLDKTPIGVQEMLGIKGFGPKKVRVVWEDLGIESTGELLYAINENRLVELKGFGAKTQASLKQQLEYHLESKDRYHYASALPLANELLLKIEKNFPKEQIELSGQIARKCNIIDSIDLVTTCSESKLLKFLQKDQETVELEGAWYYNNIKLTYITTTKAKFNYQLAKANSSEQFWSALKIPEKNYTSQEAVFRENKHHYFIPEYREDENLEHLDSYIGAHNIITDDQIRGCIHNHSTYSDGMNSLQEMVEAASSKGYEYFVITDHSKSAFYANGLTEARLMQQLDEIRQLDQDNADLKFFSGIESDILSDGSLDYADEILADLDVIVASVHSNLKMDSDKATRRLITAIENPYTSILGHPTGRLLLSRQGYPIDYAKVIEACAANHVAIELNANPNRLDLDWRWINYAINKEVLISINPDAHSTAGIEDTFYGVASARKAGLPTSYCLNAMDIDEFEEWLEQQHSKR